MTRAQAISRLGWAAAERWWPSWSSSQPSDPNPMPDLRLIGRPRHDHPLADLARCLRRAVRGPLR